MQLLKSLTNVLDGQQVCKEVNQMGIEIIKGVPGGITGTSAHEKINES